MKRITSHIKGFFANDLHIKIFSLAMAILVWFVVMNTISPVESRSYSVSIHLENSQSLMEKGYIISNRDEIEAQKVRINVEATRPALDELSNEENRKRIYANIDLGNIQIDQTKEMPQVFMLSVEPSLPSYLYTHTYSIAGYDPVYIAVEVDRMEDVTKEVEIRYNGTPAANYTITDAKLSQESVVVHGPSGKMSEISTIALNIDVTDVNADTSISATPVALDANGNELLDFIVEPSYLTVDLEVHKNETLNINEPQTIGTLAPFLEISSIDWSPKTIEVTGDEGEILELGSIDLPPVDLSQITGDSQFVHDISTVLEAYNIVPNNAEDENVVVTVSVNLVNPTNLTIQGTDINVTGLGENMSIELPEEITFEISGRTTPTVQALSPTIDVTGLTEGNHTVSLRISHQDNVAIKGPEEIEVTISVNEEITTMAAVATDNS